jgi:hypothetical protein
VAKFATGRVLVDRIAIFRNHAHDREVWVSWGVQGGRMAKRWRRLLGHRFRDCPRTVEVWLHLRYPLSKMCLNSAQRL